MAKKNKKTKNKKGSLFKRTMKVFFSIMLYLTLFIMAVGSGAAFGGGLFGLDMFLKYQKTTPELDLSKLDNPVPSVIKTSQGKFIAEIGTEDREEIKIEDVPKEFLDALISTEDSRFFKHNGFDYIRTTKAVLMNIKHGFGSQGGSTLTQQLIKLSFLDPNEGSLKRKTHELTLAWELEDMFSKQEILELYVNKIYMGDGVYGVETASKHFYGKPMKELTVPQLALLAGIPNAPTDYNPYDAPDLAKQRRDIVLYRMLDTETITEKEYNEYVKVPIDDGMVTVDVARQSTMNKVPQEYQLYVDQAIKEVKTNLKQDPFRDGLEITIALDENLQNYANDYTMTNKYIAYPNDEMMINFTVIENEHGRVLANGSGNRTTKIVPDGYNFATQSQKQAGSTMKPILSYAPAIEYLGLTPDSKVVDEPYKYSDGTPVYNWDMGYDGSMTLTRALGSSRNIPAIKLMNDTGYNKAYGLANDLGMNFAKEDYVESGPLGSISNSNPFKMASAYSSFARNGNYVQGHTVISVKDASGKLVYTEPQGKQVMKDTTAQAITTMLQSTINKPYGTAYGQIDKQGNQVALKTGTTNYADYEANAGGNLVPDSWVVGYTKDYTIAVWQGYDERTHGLTNHDQTYMAYKTFENILKELGVKNTKF